MSDGPLRFRLRFRNQNVTNRLVREVRMGSALDPTQHLGHTKSSDEQSHREIWIKAGLWHCTNKVRRNVRLVQPLRNHRTITNRPSLGEYEMPRSDSGLPFSLMYCARKESALA